MFYLFSCDGYRPVNLRRVCLSPLRLQFSDIIITLFLYSRTLCLIVTIFSQKFLQGFLLFLLFLLVILFLLTVNLCNGGIIYLCNLYTLGCGLCRDIGKLLRSNFFPGGFQLVIKFNALLLLTVDTLFLPLKVQRCLLTLLVISLFQDGDTLILYLLPGFQFQLGEVVGRFRFILVVLRSHEPADTGFLSQLGIFLLQFPCLLQISVPLFLGGFYGCILGLLIMFLDQRLSVNLTVRLALSHIKSHFREPAHRTLDIGFGSSLYLVHLFVRFHRLVHKALGFRLQEKHLDIVITLLDQHIVPLGNGIVIPEALAVFPVQLLDFSLFLFLTAGKVFQALCRIFYLETGFNHLGTPVTLYFYPFFRLFRRFLLRIAVFIPKNDKPRYYGGKP